MIERIVRPDGEVRYLSSNGQVIMDGDGTPVRMRGACVDITERVLADRERERIAARFQGLVDSAPDAILVLGDDLRVMEANRAPTSSWEESPAVIASTRSCRAGRTAAVRPSARPGSVGTISSWT